MSAPPPMDGNTFAAILVIIFTAIMSSFAFSFAMYRKIERTRETTDKWMSEFASGFQRFELQQQKQYYEIKADVGPFIEAFKESRRVKESRTMEALIAGKNPWTPREI